MATTFTAGEASDYIAQALRGKVKGQFDNHALHQAIQTVCSQFILETKYTRKLEALDVTAGNPEVDGLMSIEDFEPYRARLVWIDGFEPMEVVDLGRLLREQQRCPRVGRPKLMAFTEDLDALVWPTPDIDYDINLQWSPPFVHWTLPDPLATPTDETPDPDDDTSRDDTDLNLPADVMKIICATGIPAHLMQFAPEHAAFVQACQAKYDAFVAKLTDVTNYSPVLSRTRRR